MTVNEKQKKLIITGLMLGLLLSSLDQTITATAMPTIISKLGGLSLYSWVFSIYMLTGTASIPLFGKLADLYGRRSIYLIGMGFFVGGSALCGTATSMMQLIIFRGIQGLGSGALMPLAMIIIGDLYPPHQRGKMQGLVGAVFGISSVAGPAIGGFITEHFNWHWVFFVNLPLGLAAAIFLAVALKEDTKHKVVSIDWMGALVLVGAAISFLLVTVIGGSKGSLFVVGILLTILFVRIEAKAREPIMPLFLFKHRTITVACITGFFMGTAMFGAISYIPLFVQGVIGVSPSIAGYITTPMMLSMVTGSIMGGFLITKFRYKPIMIISLSIMAVGFALLSRMNMQTKSYEIILFMIATGLGMGILMPLLTIAVQNAVGFAHRGIATSSITFFRSIGGTLGVSIMGAVMTNRMTAGLTAGGNLGKLQNAQALLRPETRAQLPQPVLQSILKVLADSIDWVFVTGFVFVLAAIAASLFMGKGKLTKNEEAELPDVSLQPEQ